MTKTDKYVQQLQLEGRVQRVDIVIVYCPIRLQALVAILKCVCPQPG